MGESSQPFLQLENMSDNQDENVPLRDGSPPSSPTEIKGPTFGGVFLNKTKLVLLAVVIVVLILLIIILAAFLGVANAKAKHRVMGMVGAIAGSVPGMYVSKKRLYIVAGLIFVLVLIVIILAALLGKANARIKAEEDGKKGSGTGGEGTTAKPTSPSSPLPTTPGTEAWWNVRLPRDIIPDHYNVHLDINLKQLRFDGTSAIFVKVNRSTNLILVHSDRMNVTAVNVKNQAGDEQPVKKFFRFKKNQYTVIMMESMLDPGRYVIKLTFKAHLTDKLDGLYLSRYKHADGKNVTIAATQFQPTDARKAFPCFDEPALKATFNISLTHRSDFISLSNMPIWKNETKDYRTTDYFEKTVVMPTYLLAFVVCDFKHKENKTENGVLMRYFAPPDKIDQVDYALSVGGRMMTFFESYYNIKYPLPKADMIAIPDFAAGAMENWGLITYRESALLWKNGTSSASNKQRVAAVIAHELAHQWFGNLVTMEWWDDLWLNEGFASFLEYDGVNEVEKTWGMFGQFVVNDMDSAFSLDGLATSHPIKVDVNHPSEINEIFDSISYNKGAAILRMLQAFIGKKTFAAGLTKYLNKHKYANAETDDLWQSLKEESCLQGPCVDVKRIMDTWTLQMGYPVVTLTRKDASHVTLSQKHFLYDRNANISASKYKSPFNYTWVVPFTYKTSSMAQPKTIYMNRSSADIAWDGSGWLKGNFGTYGYFRVNYDDSNWEKLTKQLKSNHQILSISDRAGLISDAFSLARARHVNYTHALETTAYLKNETDYVPWSAALGEVNYIRDRLSRSSQAYKHLERYLMYNAKPRYDALGFQDVGGHLEKFQRTSMLSIFCRNHEKSCVDTATKLFKKWMQDPVNNRVSANLKGLVYYYGVANGGEKEWDFVYDQFKKTESASAARTLLYALSATREMWILSRYLEYSLDSSKIRPQDTTRVVYYVANYNPQGRQLAWDFVRLNWATFQERYGGGFFAFRNLILGVTGGFSNEFQLQELIEFNKKNKNAGSGARAQIQAEERVRANIQWVKENEQDVEKWLEKFIKDHNVP